MCAPYLKKLKPTFFRGSWNVTVYIWLQLCQILTDFNNFCTAETGKKCTQQGMQRVYHSIVKDVDELRERLISMWCELDQSVVNHAIDEWRRRLSACVNTEGGHFEHYLWLLLSNNNVEMATL